MGSQTLTHITLMRFEHINLSCHDLKATQSFYQTLFPDWRIRAQGDHLGTHWIHLGNDQVYLALNHHPEQERVHCLYENTGINHVGFVIDDGDAMKAVLQQAGIDYYTMTSPETKHRIYVTDPDGNELELVEYQSDYRLR